MAKAPRAGDAKTRLRTSLPDEAVDTLAAAFFVDTLNTVRILDLEIIIAFTPDDGREELRGLAGGDDSLVWVDQRGVDLGERLDSAMRFARERKSGPIVFVGTDSPNVPAKYVRAAFDMLSSGSADLVLGPASDGGYYLIGLRDRADGLFDGVEWSTERVFRRTASNAAGLGLTVQRLPEWYDVDTVDDLARLSGDLVRDPHSAEATSAWLKSNGSLFPP